MQILAVPSPLAEGQFVNVGHGQTVRDVVRADRALAAQVVNVPGAVIDFPPLVLRGVVERLRVLIGDGEGEPVTETFVQFDDERVEARGRARHVEDVDVEELRVRPQQLPPLDRPGRERPGRDHAEEGIGHLVEQRGAEAERGIRELVDVDPFVEAVVPERELPALRPGVAELEQEVPRDFVLDVRAVLLNVRRGPHPLERGDCGPDPGGQPRGAAGRRVEAVGEGVTQRVVDRPPAVERGGPGRVNREADVADRADVDRGLIVDPVAGAGDELFRDFVGDAEAGREVVVRRLPLEGVIVRDELQTTLEIRQPRGGRERAGGVEVEPVEPVVALGARPLNLVAQPDIDRQPRIHVPGVLQIQGVVSLVGVVAGVARRVPGRPRPEEERGDGVAGGDVAPRVRVRPGGEETVEVEIGRDRRRPAPACSARASSRT